MEPETKILLLAARTRLLPEQEAALARLVTGPVRWQPLVEVACAHGVAPLLHRHLERAGLMTHLPPECAAPLARTAHAAALRGLRLRAELGALLAAADGERLPVMLLKGASLAERVYGDWGLRPMADLDLLVPRGRYERFEALLHRLGYRLIPQHARTRSHWEQTHCHLTFAHPHSGVVVEAHWDLQPLAWDWPAAPRAASVWERARRTSLDGVLVHMLSPADEIVHLALHHFRHGALCLLAHCDLAEVVRREGEPALWDALIQVAAETRAETVIGYALWWARRYLETPVPEGVVAELCPDAERRDRRLVGLGGVVPPPDLVHNPWVVLARQIPFAPGIRHRLRCAQRVLVPLPGAVLAGEPERGVGWRYLRYLLSARRLRRAGSHLLALVARGAATGPAVIPTASAAPWHTRR